MAQPWDPFVDGMFVTVKILLYILETALPSSTCVAIVVPSKVYGVSS